MADATLTALAALTALHSDDNLYVVYDPGGTPVSKKITVANALGMVPLAKSTTYTITEADFGQLVIADATSSAFTVTLPDTPADGFKTAILKSDSSANRVTIARGGSDTIGIGADTSITLNVHGDLVWLVYDATNTNWVLVVQRRPLAFYAGLTSNQDISEGTYTKVQFNNAVVDTNGDFDNVTNYRWTPSEPGLYVCIASFGFDSLSDGAEIKGQIRFNGSATGGGRAYSAKTDGAPSILCFTVQECDGEDYFELWAYYSGSGSSEPLDASYTYMMGWRL